MPPSHARPRSARVMFWILIGVIGLFALHPRLTLVHPDALGGLAQYANHAFAFAALVLLGALGWGLQWRLVTGLAGGAAVLELVQSQSPGREAAFTDLAASIAGIALGIGCARGWERIRPRPSDQRPAELGSSESS